MDLKTTYFEEQTGQTFNWLSFLSKEDYTHEEWDNAVGRAGNWVSCACGNQCAIIPRYETGNMQGQPVDITLHDLGMRFFNNIKYKDIDTAKETLIAIEKRSSELIEEILKKKR